MLITLIILTIIVFLILVALMWNHSEHRNWILRNYEYMKEQQHNEMEIRKLLMLIWEKKRVQDK